MSTTKVKYVKLGDGANSFSDSRTKTRFNKKTVMELTPEMGASKKISVALKQGHLQYAEAEEFDAFQASKGNATNMEINLEGTDQDDQDETREEQLLAMNKSDLQAEALTLFGDLEAGSTEQTEATIKKMNKDELAAFIIANEEEEDEE